MNDIHADECNLKDITNQQESLTSSSINNSSPQSQYSVSLGTSIEKDSENTEEEMIKNLSEEKLHQPEIIKFYEEESSEDEIDRTLRETLSCVTQKAKDIPKFMRSIKETQEMNDEYMRKISDITPSIHCILK